MRQHQQEWEGTPLPAHHGSVIARVENFGALDSDCLNLDIDDAYDILGRLWDDFTIGYCRLSTDEIDMIPTLLEVKADTRDESIKAHFEFSRFGHIGDDRLIVYYKFTTISFYDEQRIKTNY